MMSQNQALADHLRMLRVDRDLTLQELAAKSGVSRATLSRIENAEVSPTAESLGRLASAFTPNATASFSGRCNSLRPCRPISRIAVRSPK